MNMNLIKEKLKGQGNSRRSRLIAEPVREALIEFCRQSDEFAQTIEQSDKTFDECMSAVTKGSKECLSDLDAYRKAVQFYFSTADISFHMTINLSSDNGYEPPPIEVTKNEKIEVSLDSLLDF